MEYIKRRPGGNTIVATKKEIFGDNYKEQDLEYVLDRARIVEPNWSPDSSKPIEHQINEAEHVVDCFFHRLATQENEEPDYEKIYPAMYRGNITIRRRISGEELRKATLLCQDRSAHLPISFENVDINGIDFSGLNVSKVDVILKLIGNCGTLKVNSVPDKVKQITFDQQDFSQMTHQLPLGIKKVTISECQNVAQLSGLTSIDELEIRYSDVDGFDFGMPNLKKLSITCSKLTSIAEIAKGCPNLEELNVSNNQLTSLLASDARQGDNFGRPISFSKLRKLNISHTQIPNISGLEGVFPIVTDVVAEKSELTDLSGISNVFPRLEQINLSGITKLTDITPLLEYRRILQCIQLSETGIGLDMLDTFRQLCPTQDENSGYGWNVAHTLLDEYFENAKKFKIDLRGAAGIEELLRSVDSSEELTLHSILGNLGNVLINPDVLKELQSLPDIAKEIRDISIYLPDCPKSNGEEQAPANTEAWSIRRIVEEADKLTPPIRGGRKIRLYTNSVVDLSDEDIDFLDQRPNDVCFFYEAKDEGKYVVKEPEMNMVYEKNENRRNTVIVKPRCVRGNSKNADLESREANMTVDDMLDFADLVIGVAEFIRSRTEQETSEPNAIQYISNCYNALNHNFEVLLGKRTGRGYIHVKTKERHEFEKDDKPNSLVWAIQKRCFIPETCDMLVLELCKQLAIQGVVMGDSRLKNIASQNYYTSHASFKIGDRLYIVTNNENGVLHAKINAERNTSRRTDGHGEGPDDR